MKTIFSPFENILLPLEKSTRMKFFGEWGPGDAERVETPVGQPCVHCSETIEAGDDGVCLLHLGVTVAELPWHRECFIRSIFGSASHQDGTCTCVLGPSAADTGTPGSKEDQDGISLRESARQALKVFLEQRIRARIPTL